MRCIKEIFVFNQLVSSQYTLFSMEGFKIPKNVFRVDSLVHTQQYSRMRAQQYIGECAWQYVRAHAGQYVGASSQQKSIAHTQKYEKGILIIIVLLAEGWFNVSRDPERR